MAALMKKIFVLAVLIAPITLAKAQSFSAGDLVVLQVGDGSASLSSAATPLFIREYSTLGMLQQTITLPSSGGSAFTTSGSATSEGALTLSADSTLLTLGGYAAPAGTASIASSSAARAVGVLNASGTFSIGASSSSAFLANNIRGAVSDGRNYWMSGTGSGTSGGLWYSSNGGTPSQITAAGGNFRVANIFNGNLYYSTGAGTRGIYGFSGVPTATSSATFLFGNGSSSSPYDFSINPAGTTAYVADDSSPSAGGGIEKWTFNGASWSLAYTLTNGLPSGARGLTVDFSGSSPIIFATTGESISNRLVEIIDTGVSAAALTLATAPANEIFRGVDFTPSAVPEPSACALLALGGALLYGVRRLKLGRRK